MRVITRADFDGLICAMLLKEQGVADDYLFVHPKDVQDGLVDVSSSDILANVPYDSEAGLWFDRHDSEQKRIAALGVIPESVNGAFHSSPSTARVIYHYYGPQKFPEYMTPLVEMADKISSADFTKQELENPQGWMMLGLALDPRSMISTDESDRERDALMKELVECCRAMPVEEVLNQPIVAEILHTITEHSEAYRETLKAHSTLTGNVVVTDMRNCHEQITGSRFAVYALFPQCHSSLFIMWDKKQENVILSAGYNPLSKVRPADIGALMMRYGGGGLAQVGGCQVYGPLADGVIQEIIDVLKE